MKGGWDCLDKQVVREGMPLCHDEDRLLCSIRIYFATALVAVPIHQLGLPTALGRVGRQAGRQAGGEAGTQAGRQAGTHAWKEPKVV